MFVAISYNIYWFTYNLHINTFHYIHQLLQQNHTIYMCNNALAQHYIYLFLYFHYSYN